jgi:hypothetical protein
LTCSTDEILYIERIRLKSITYLPEFEDGVIKCGDHSLSTLFVKVPEINNGMISYSIKSFK